MSKDHIKNPDPDTETEPVQDPPATEKTEPETEKEPSPDPGTKEPECDPKSVDEPNAPEETEPGPATADELATLQHELLAANAKLAAYKAGVPSGAVDDAVVLAMHDLKTAGEDPTPESIAAAITAVLLRHPDWSHSKTPPAPAKAGAPEPEKKSVAKTLPSGTVIF